VRLILSRKGFDASLGGTASPILPDGSLCSLPIPDPLSPLRYAEIATASKPLGRIVEELTHGQVGARDFAHLDPDLDRQALQRSRGWRPIFGQTGAAQSHLARHGVGPGDVFLFFGWFRRCAYEGGRLCYAQGAPDLHVLFGWLEVGEVVSVAQLGPRDLRWARRHPHFFGARGAGNTFYLAAERLSARTAPPGPGRWPGAGRFPRFERRLCLTARPGAGPRGLWGLPEWIRTPKGPPLLTHHRDPRRWTQVPGGWLLRTVGRGQEFILDLDQSADPSAGAAWLQQLIRVAGPKVHG
jgi:hypothetical protein